jgi:cell division protein FtsA
MQDGAVIVDFGGGVTDVSVLYGGKVRYVASIPIGASSINNDIRSLSIPSNYIEDLKIQYGSAISALAVDDMIVFQAAKCRLVKNILRKNLAIVIEARLKEIAEWVRREIKEAGCGSKFQPTLLLTGGGSQMRDIEKLFARELDIEDARTVHPEYGFTEESMLEHITSPADATVASLLVYGAKLGSCTVGVRSVTEQPQPEDVKTPGDRRSLSDYSKNTAQNETTQQTQTTPASTSTTTPTSTPTPTPTPTPKKPVYTLDDEEDDMPKKSKKGLGERLRGIFEKAGSTIIGDVEEGEY